MPRIGEKVLRFPTGVQTVSMGGRKPKVGDKVIRITTPEGPTLSVKQFNAYEGDEGVSCPLPCGMKAFMASEPPNYLPQSWASGFGMSCSQGIPQTSGWTCSGSCPINPSTHPTPGETCRRAYGLPLPWTDANACTHSLGSGSWRANMTYHWDVTFNYYGCRSRCYQEYEQYGGGTYKVYCPLYGTETVVAHQMSNGAVSGTTYPQGCYKTSNRYVTRIWKAAALDGQFVDAFYSYACNGPKTVCPRFNGGAGTPFPVCGIKGANDKGPSFSPGQKPAGCKNQGYLSFDGWSVPGGEQNANTGCVLGKATEGARSQSDDVIRCKFMSPSGSIGEVSGAGDVVNPISPSNTSAFGKAGSQLSVNANISIGGRVDMDYTRVPTRYSKSGTACAFTIGRY